MDERLLMVYVKTKCKMTLPISKNYLIITHHNNY
jgi:hypothetical protein